MGLKRTQAEDRDYAPEARRDCRELEQQLQHTDAAARRWAARDLVECGAGVGPVLVARLLIERDSSVREVIFTTLTRIADDEVSAAMVQLLRSEDSALRNEAVQAMKHMPQQMGGIMQSLLCDSDADVRLFAVNILESLCHPKVELWLCAVLESDEDVNVCGGALDLLSEVGTEEARESLQRVKQRFAGQAYIQFAADLALKRIGALGQA